MFNRAIYQSGSDVTLWAVNYPESEPENYTKQVATQLDCPTEDSSSMIDCLRGKDAADVVDPGVDCTVRIPTLFFRLLLHTNCAWMIQASIGNAVSKMILLVYK